MTEEATEELVMTAYHCRHCGAERAEDALAMDDDWLCAECEHWQDSMACPTCGSTVRASLMPADMVPAAAKPKRARREG